MTEVEEAYDSINFNEPNGEVTCNLSNVYDCLKTGLVGEDDVDLGAYLTAYRELYNFFLLLGKAFAFVASDVKSKIMILDDFRKDEIINSGKIDNFSTVKKMIEYEKSNKLLENRKYVSGSRTLLRLHRGLDFIRNFLGEVHKLDDGDKLNAVCRKSYDETLAPYHTWIIRNAATLAMHLLPTKQELIKKITKNDDEQHRKATVLLPEMLELMKIAYDRVNNLYTLHKLHDLP